jgi:hypothetical protein
MFAYSIDDVNYTNMFSVENTTDSGHVSFVLPSSIQGTVYVGVIDSDRTSGNIGFDTIFVDELFIRSALNASASSSFGENTTSIVNANIAGQDLIIYSSPNGLALGSIAMTFILFQKRRDLTG